MRKYKWPVRITVVLFSIVITFGIFAHYEKQTEPELFSLFGLLSLHVAGDEWKVAVSAVKDSDGTYCFYLPSGAARCDIKWNIPGGYTLEINGKTYKNGEIYRNPVENTALAAGFVNSKGKIEESRTVAFYQTGFIPSVHIQTQSGSMDFVNEDKNNKESAEMTIVTNSGAVDFKGPLGYIKGRGSSTWNAPKKPYNIQLPRAQSLLGMSECANWCLLANYFDKSNLRNKITMDFALAIGMPSTPESRFVDLYLNGEYAGLYLLTEKISVEKGSVDISDLAAETSLINTRTVSDYKEIHTRNYKGFSINNNPEDITGGYLLVLAQGGRDEYYDSAFFTDNGSAIGLCSPKHASALQMEYIRRRINDFEKALYADDGYNKDTGKRYTDYIDVDSWLKRLFVVNFFDCADSSFASQYFYKDKDGIDSRIYGDIVWDFDFSMGSYGLWGHSYHEADAFVTGGWWYEQLFSHEDFFQKLTDEYKKRYSACMKHFLENNVKEYIHQIEGSARMNANRWGIDDDQEQKNSLMKYLNKRLKYYDDIWIHKQEYNTVTMTFWSSQREFEVSYSFGVVSGEKIQEVPSVIKPGFRLIGWYDGETGDVFDFEEPVIKDIQLRAVLSPVNPAPLPDEMPLPRKLIVFSLNNPAYPAAGLFVALLLLFVILEIRRNRSFKRI